MMSTRVTTAKYNSVTTATPLFQNKEKYQHFPAVNRYEWSEYSF